MEKIFRPSNRVVILVALEAAIDEYGSRAKRNFQWLKNNQSNPEQAKVFKECCLYWIKKRRHVKEAKKALETHKPLD